MAKIASIKVEKGSLDDLTTGTIAVLDTGEGKAPAVGSTVVVEDSRGKDVDLRVVAVLAPTQDTGQTGSIIDGHTFDSLVATSRPPSPSSTSPRVRRAARRTRSRTSPTSVPTSPRKRATRSASSSAACSTS